MSTQLLERKNDIGQAGRSQAAEELVVIRVPQRYDHCRALCEESHAAGFQPAFLDTHTGVVYLSRFLNGQIAPLHFFDALPSNLVERDSNCSQARRLKNFVVAGYVSEDQFYTREEAAKVKQDTAGSLETDGRSRKGNGTRFDQGLAHLSPRRFNQRARRSKLGSDNLCGGLR